MSVPEQSLGGQLAEWLSCPNCGRSLRAATPLTVTCPNGHSLDCNKRGYFNSLTAPSKFLGDDPDMLDARARLLHSGAFEPIVDAIRTLAPYGPSSRVVDFGCGTGYYLSALLRSRPGWSALAVDLSPAAVARARSCAPGVVGLVADMWRPLPILDGAAEVALNVFAPHNPAEFHRILKPGGVMIVVVPHPEHLKELQELGITLTVPAGKTQRLIENFEGRFRLAEQCSVTSSTQLTAGTLADIIAMGPSAHHSAQLSPLSDVTLPDVTLGTATISVDVLRFTRF